MTSRKVGTGAAAGLLLGMFAEVALAQSLAGRVADDTGAPLAAVTVVAVSTASRHESVARTDSDGRYQLKLPSVGTFDVRYTAPGFVEHRISGVDVTEAEKSVDVTLQLTTFADQIQVAAELRETHSTGSRLGLTRRQTPASIDVVTQDVIQARGADTASTALRHVTGLTSSLRPGASAVFSSRGFIENSLGVLFNGVRVQSSTITMRNYDAFNFERVEVLRGPASVLHGEGLAAGAINFVRREAIPGRTRVDGLLETGDAGRIRFGIAAAGSAGARNSYSVSFARNRFETHVEDNEHEYNHLAGAFRTSVGRVNVGVEGDVLVNAVDDPYWGTPLVNGAIDERLVGRNYNRSSNNRYDDTVGWGRLTAAAALTPRIVWNGQVYTYRADRDWQNSYGFEVLPDTGRVLRRAVETLAYDHRLWGTRHDVTADFRLAGRTARVVAGVDVAMTDFSSPRSYGPRVSVDMLAPEALDFAAPSRADDRRADVRQTAAYGELRVDVAAPVTLVVGGRAGTVSNDIARPASGVAFEQSFTPLDGRVGAVYTPVPDVSIYGQYATGSEPIEALLILGPAERDFDLARSESWEGGVKARLWGGRTELSAAAYRLSKRDLTTTDPEDGTRTVQVGRQSSRGFELSLLTRVSDRWLVEANLAALDARYDLFFEGAASRNGNLPPNVPEIVVNVGTTVRPVSRIEAGFWLSHIGRRAADLTLRVRNAGDTRFVEWATRAFGVTNVYFGEPRRVIASLRVRL